MRRIYLDYNATTPVLATTLAEMEPFFVRHFGNPSSEHVLGRAAAEAIEDAREHVAMMLGAMSGEIVFTSGGTESNNFAIKGLFLRPDQKKRHFVTTRIEHPAISEPARFLKRMGVDVTLVGCDARGVVDPEAVRDAIRDDTALVSVMHANNEVGAIQPIREIATICRQRGVLVHTDAAQSVGKIPTDVGELGVDLLSIAGHKLYAPKGVGALYVRDGVVLEPLLHGAGHEHGLRAGTEATPSIVGLGSAARLATRELDANRERIAKLRNQLWEQLSAQVDALQWNGQSDNLLPNTLSVNFPRVVARDILARIPELCVSTGAACHSGSTKPSATLTAMGIDEATARGTIRLSLGWLTTPDEIEHAADLLAEAWFQLKA